VKLYTIPPRSRVVHIDQPHFQGEMVCVATLPETAFSRKLRGLISGDQLTVSQCGQSVGIVLTRSRTTEIVQHSDWGPIGTVFVRPTSRPDEGTRILHVTDEQLLVWGRVQGYPLGVWRLTGTDAEFLTRMDALVGPHLISGMPLIRGVCDDQPGQELFLTPWGVWPVNEQSTVSWHPDGLCVVEQLDRQLYAYIVTSQGVRPFITLNLQEAEYALGVVNWKDRLMLGVCRGTQSWLIELTPARSETLKQIQLDGELQGVWSSPTGMTLAMLVHPRGLAHDVHRLQLSNGRIVQQGRFAFNPNMLIWSPDEQLVVVKPRSSQIPELLVDNSGSVAAFIYHDGDYDQMVLGGRRGTKVPLAWNLHYDSTGSIVWTSVLGQEILTWVWRGTQENLIHAA
jgi:hypothetical protein